MGGLFYLSQQNRDAYLDFKVAYQKELRGEEHQYSNLNVPASVLKNLRDANRKAMEQAYIFLTLSYLVQLAEAYVDAHLMDFDVGDDLSVRWSPTAIPTSHANWQAGIRFRFQRSPQRVTLPVYP